MDDFPTRLRKLRESKHPAPPRKVVSELCGLHSDAIRRYERGEAEPSMEALKAIALHFDVSADYLLGLTDNKR